MSGEFIGYVIYTDPDATVRSIASSCARQTHGEFAEGGHVVGLTYVVMYNFGKAENADQFAEKLARTLHDSGLSYLACGSTQNQQIIIQACHQIFGALSDLRGGGKVFVINPDSGQPLKLPPLRPAPAAPSVMGVHRDW